MITTNDVIKRFEKVHDKKYDYSKVVYKGAREKVCIICPIHGEFWQRVDSHSMGNGCKECNRTKPPLKKTSTKEAFIKKAKEIHGDKYDYSKVIYVNSKTKVCIICPKHGEFWQTPNKHLLGQGCSKCKNSTLETVIENKLKKEGIVYEVHKFFKWLRFNGPQHIDFYLPEYNVAIECQGEQHYNNKAKKYNTNFVLTIKRDENKYRLIKEHGIKMLYFTKKIFYKNNNHLSETFFTVKELFEQIKASGR